MSGPFASVIERVRGPISIIALAFLILYAVYQQVLKLRVFRPIGSQATLSILHAVLAKLFWLAIAALVLGFGSYLASEYIEKQPVKLSSSTQLIDARFDPNLSQDVAHQISSKPTAIAQQP